jgi:putative transposase
VAQKAGLNRAILDNMPGERRRQLAYKCPFYGSELRAVLPYHTSTICPNPERGKVDPRNRVGCGRQFACVNCGWQDHADHAASVNILARAEQQQSAEQTAGRAEKSTGRR